MTPSNGLRPGEIIVDSRRAAELVHSHRRLHHALHAIEGLDEAVSLARDALAGEPDYDAIPEYVSKDALLSDAAVERAARALNLEAGRQRGLAFEDDWDEITEQERGGWRLCARAALSAGLDAP